MTYAYSNNGMSFRAVDPDYEPQDGEVVFPEEAMQDQLAAAFPDYVATQSARAWAERQVTALANLEDSDRIVLRCYEDGVPVPAEWVAYRKALRAIVGSTFGDPTQSLPAQPAYPAGA